MTRKQEPLSGSAVILAGGAGTRMGEIDKGQLVIGDETFLERKVRGALSLFPQVVISLPAGADKAELSPNLLDDGRISFVADRISGYGPLMGMEAAFSAASEELLWVTTVDSPLFSSQLVANLMKSIGAADVLLPLNGGKREPLFGVYRRSCLHEIVRSIEEGKRRIISFFDRVHVSYCSEKEVRKHDPDLISFININTQEDYEKFITWISNRYS